MATTILPGPLTSFNPPSSCFSQIWGTVFPSETAPAIVLGNPYDTACKPPRFGTDVIYSPALCPSSYYDAGKQVITQNAITETVLACCPINFSSDGGTFNCVSTFPSTADVTYTLSTNGRTVTTSKPYTAGQGLNAHSIQVRYQSSDSAVLFASPTSSSSQTTTTSTTSSNVAAPITSAPITPSASPVSTSDSGLSTGAKAGIGVGVALGAIAVIGAVIWVIQHRKRKNRESSHYNSVHPSPTSYLDNTPHYEMGAPSTAGVKQEPSYVKPVELDTSRR